MRSTSPSNPCDNQIRPINQLISGTFVDSLESRTVKFPIPGTFRLSRGQAIWRYHREYRGRCTAGLQRGLTSAVAVSLCLPGVKRAGGGKATTAYWRFNDVLSSTVLAGTVLASP